MIFLWIPFSKIGAGKTTDYTSRPLEKVQYTDVKKAYTDTFLVNSEEVTRPHYSGVNDIQRERSNISFTMNESDRQRQAVIDDRLKSEENLRIQRVSNNDRLIEEHYKKMNNIFIGYQN